VNGKFHSLVSDENGDAGNFSPPKLKARHFVFAITEPNKSKEPILKAGFFKKEN
jgi:hypothetical protein